MAKSFEQEANARIEAWLQKRGFASEGAANEVRSFIKDVLGITPKEEKNDEV